MSIRKTAIAAAAFLLVATSSVVAGTLTLTTDDTGYSGPTLDLSAFENGSYNFTFGPINLPGGIVFTAAPGGGGNSGIGSVIGQGSYGLGGNGNFGGSSVFIGVDSGTGFAELSFAAPASSFGAYWNYAGPTIIGDAPTLSAYDIVGNLLGSFDLSTEAPISTPGGFNAFAFRGLESTDADIARVRFGGSYILLAATPEGAPVAPETPTIPVPAAFPLLLGALSAFGAIRLRARKG